jgi:hypothetical protein
MLRFDEFNELGVLPIVNVCTEGYVVDRKSARYSVPFEPCDFLRFIHDILYRALEKARSLNLKGLPLLVFPLPSIL